MLRPDASRKKEYKKGIDAEEARRKREDNIIALRQNKRDENLQKKRSTFAPASANANFGIEDSTKNAVGRVSDGTEHISCCARDPPLNVPPALLPRSTSWMSCP